MKEESTLQLHSRPNLEIKLGWVRNCSEVKKTCSTSVAKNRNQTQAALPRMQNGPAPDRPMEGQEKNGVNWENEEMKWFTQLATQRISGMLKSLTSLMRFSKKKAVRASRATQRGESLTGLA